MNINITESYTDSDLLMFSRKNKNDLRKIEQYTNIILVASDGTEFPAHKNTLASASEYFRGTLKRNKFNIKII